MPTRADQSSMTHPMIGAPTGVVPIQAMENSAITRPWYSGAAPRSSSDWVAARQRPEAAPPGTQMIANTTSVGATHAAAMHSPASSGPSLAVEGVMDELSSDGADVRPTVTADSHSWVGEMDRFGRLFEGGFRDDATVNAVMQRVEQLLEPPAAVEDVLQREAWRYAEDVKPEAAGQFAQLYYGAMRNGWSAAEAVLFSRSGAASAVDNEVFFARLSALTQKWFEGDPWAELSDLAFYVLDDLLPAVRHHVEELLTTVVPSVELPSGWELLPPLRMPLDRATSGLLFATAVAMAYAGVEII